MYKAVFTDMDGTLLKKDHTISDATKKIIQQMIQKGIMVVPVSARPLHGMLPITASVFKENMPVVSLNGSYIFLKGEIIHDIRMTHDDSALIHKEILPYAVTPLYYSQMEWYSHLHNEMTKKEQRITDVKIITQHFEQTIKHWQETHNGPNKITIAGDKEIIARLQEKLRNLFGEKFNILTSQPRYLEIMHRDASKKLAIQLVMDRYGLKREEVMAIGDNFNDKEMIEFAGMGIAMGNAPDEIKQAADYVTDTNIHDGVAKALEHFFF